MKRIGVLLGAGTDEKGRLKYNAKRRADKARRMLLKGEIWKIMLCGGDFSGIGITEADAYKRYLVKKKVNPRNLILEEESKDTIGNAIYSKKIIMKKKLPKNLIVITSDYHLERALMIFEHIYGKGYEITGEASRSHIVHRLLKRFREFEYKELEHMLLATIRYGDHKTAEKLMKRFVPRYQNSPRDF